MNYDINRILEKTTENGTDDEEEEDEGILKFSFRNPNRSQIPMMKMNY